MPSRRTVTFVGPARPNLRAETLPSPPAGQMLVKTSVSAISSGTEMLVYRGQFPGRLSVDENIPALQGDFHYPLCYGYAAVGSVIELGQGLPADWLGRAVFSFQPHTSYFLATPEAVFPLPAAFPRSGLLLPNMETAVNFIQDGAPLLGENVLVFGQGIIGLLTAALLSQFPLSSLITVDDKYACRGKPPWRWVSPPAWIPRRPASMNSCLPSFRPAPI